MKKHLVESRKLGLNYAELQNCGKDIQRYRTIGHPAMFGMQGEPSWDHHSEHLDIWKLKHHSIPLHATPTVSRQEPVSRRFATQKQMLPC